MITFANVLLLLATLVQVVGTVLMAAQFANAPRHHLPQMMLSALRKGEYAAGMVEIARMTGERPLEFVQGLSFVCLGFVIQAVGITITMLA